MNQISTDEKQRHVVLFMFEIGVSEMMASVTAKLLWLWCEQTDQVYSVVSD